MGERVYKKKGRMKESDIFIEVDCFQKNKAGNIVCGDSYMSQKLKEEDRIISVLSDGLGSGIKASVLSAMTATMAMNYTAMKAEREILCRAALTRTLTQIEGIDYINIYCGDQPLMDRQGNPVGMLSATDFIMNTSNVNAYEKTELTLYFADETGNRLVPEKREVVHNINTSLEQLVVEQLIAGPGQEGHNPTLPSDCKILSLSVTDNVCYINFDSAFANTTLAVNEYIPIYSIVDSLSEMTTVTKVQIMINGSQDVMFRDVVSLNTTFERSQNYIDGKNE